MSYVAKRDEPMTKAWEESPTRPKFRVSYKQLLSTPGVADKLKFPQKTDRKLGSQKDAWCEFHKAFGHNVERCIALGHQLASFVKEYLEADQEETKRRITLKDQAHEPLVHEELNTISGGFLGGGNSASKRKRYARAVMSLEARILDHPPEPTLCLTSLTWKMWFVTRMMWW